MKILKKLKLSEVFFTRLNIVFGLFIAAFSCHLLYSWRPFGNIITAIIIYGIFLFLFFIPSWLAKKYKNETFLSILITIFTLFMITTLLFLIIFLFIRDLDFIFSGECVESGIRGCPHGKDAFVQYMRKIANYSFFKIMLSSFITSIFITIRINFSIFSKKLIGVLKIINFIFIINTIITIFYSFPWMLDFAVPALLPIIFYQLVVVRKMLNSDYTCYNAQS